MRTKTNMELKNYYLTVKEIEKLHNASKDMGISVSELLRRIIDGYFEKLKNKNEKT